MAREEQQSLDEQIRTPLLSQTERRAQMDAQTFNGLLLVNGGGAVAFLTFLTEMLKPAYQAHYRPIVIAMLWGLIIMMFGLAFAIFHNIFRRRCSEDFGSALPAGWLASPLRWLRLVHPNDPNTCVACWLLALLSAIAFVVAGITVAIVGIRVI